jgi:acetyltransferase-like isoleucine patch superfamily enzyme
MRFNMQTFKHAGKNLKIAENVKILNPELVSVGDNVTFYYGVYVQPTGGEIVIGSDTHFAPFGIFYGPLSVGNKCAVAAHVVFASVAHSHADSDVPFIEQPMDQRMITLEDNVWIGANAVILPGVRIGTGSIIGAGAVVTKDVPPYSVMGGVPVRLIRKRKED